MTGFINSLTAALQDIWSSAIGLFTILAVIGLGLALLALLLSRKDPDRYDAIRRIVTILIACAGFGVITSIIESAMHIGG